LRELNIYSNFRRITLSDSEHAVAVSERGFNIPTEFVEDRLTGQKVDFTLSGTSANGSVTNYEIEFSSD